MFIKNQTFTSEELLLEMIFDFSLGDATPLIDGLNAAIDEELEANETFKKYRASLTDEEDIEALDAEERDMRLAEKLMERFDSFVVQDARLYGSKDGVRELLYEVDLV